MKSGSAKKEPLIIGECSKKLFNKILSGEVADKDIKVAKVPMINKNGHWATLHIYELNKR